MVSNKDSVRESYSKLMLFVVQSKRCLCQAAESLDLTTAQSMLLIITEPNSSKSMYQLATQMGCDASNITGLVDKLESKDLIKRTVDPEDKRVKVISLTKKGSDHRNRLLDVLRENNIIDLSKLTQNEQDSFIDLLNKLTI